MCPRGNFNQSFTVLEWLHTVPVSTEGGLAFGSPESMTMAAVAEIDQVQNGKTTPKLPSSHRPMLKFKMWNCLLLVLAFSQSSAAKDGRF